MTKSLYVGNLGSSISADQVRELFESKGLETQSVKLATGGKNAKPRGFAFVEMENEEVATAAIAALAGASIDGRELKIGEAAKEKSALRVQSREDDYGGNTGRFGSGGKRGRR